ncbi:MAG: STAS domain-containing protein [Peptococcaceae bacterium]|nr:STAS domain-containing protein [Peptococcaceae bacterium]
MLVEIDLPLLLTNVEEIRERLLKQVAAGARKVVFTSPGVDAAGLQLIIALRKEFPGVEVELPPEGPGEVFRSLLAEEVIPDVQDPGS